MKKEKNFTGTLFCLLLMFFCVFTHVCFAGENYFQKGTFVDFNGTAHNGLDKNHGAGVGFGIGGEYLYVVNSNFAIGISGKTNLNFDAYMDYSLDDVTLVDEYGTWAVTGGGIVYIGDYVFVGYNAIYNILTFHHDTYLSYDDSDEDVDPLDYDIDVLNYSVTLGVRLRYHLAMYVDVTTHQIKNGLDNNKRQYYLGIKYYI